MSKASALAALKSNPVVDLQSAVHPPPGSQPGLLTPNVPTGGERQVQSPVEPVAGTGADPAAGAAGGEPGKDDLQSSRLAIFAKKEAALQKEREALKKDREEWEKSEKAEASRIVGLEKQFKETFSKDKLAAFRLLGYTDTDLINMMTGVEENKAAGGGGLSPDEVRAIIREETGKVRQEFEEKEKNQLSERNESMVKGLKADIKEMVKAQAEKYEYCAFEGNEANEKAYQIIHDHLKATVSDDKPYGELLTIEAALDIAEEYFEKRDEAMQVLKKRQAKFGGTAAAASGELGAPTSAKEGEPTRSNMPQPRGRTLTNSVTASAAAAAAPQNETREQKKERLSKYLLSLNRAA